MTQTVIAQKKGEPHQEFQNKEFDVNVGALLGLLKKNWKIIGISPIIFALVALLISFLVPPAYTATTNFLPPQQQNAAASMIQSLGALGGIAGGAAGLKNPTDQYISFLKSRSLQDSLIDRFKLQDRYDQKYREDTRVKLNLNTIIASGKDGIITINSTDRDPKFAAVLANAHVEEFQVLLNRLAVTEAQQRRMFFEKQLIQTKEALSKADLALRASGVDASTLKSNPQASIETISRLKATITATEIKLSSLRSYLADGAAEVRQAQTELLALRNQLSKAEQNDVTPSANTSDYVSKYREYKYQETLYDMFARQYELAKVDESREGSVVQVLDKALPPEKRSKPVRLPFLIIGGLVGFIFSLAFLLFRHKNYKNIFLRTKAAV
ncbi:MAG: lipopolysaccharide biosynthesis protein [Burkholderiales bacterium]|nr:lipopolysaccharide biosynthesis protein [Burkholderiales bacterium]